jgi:hypothetical protein
MSFAVGERNPRILHGFYCEVRFCTGKWAVQIRNRNSGRSGTLRDTRLRISWASSTDSSMALLVGTTRTFTCRSLASRIPSILDASDTPAGFLYIVPFGTSFSDKLEEISLWLPVRSQQDSPETAPFESGFSESLVYVARIYSRASLRPPSRCWRVTNWSGRPRKTSDGRYRRCSPQGGHSTVMD